MAKITYKSKVTPQERVALYKALSEVLKPSEKEGLFKYDAGFSDAKVAELAGCTTARVCRIRASLFGKLEHTADYVPIPEIIQRLKVLETTVLDLIDTLKKVGVFGG